LLGVNQTTTIPASDVVADGSRLTPLRRSWQFDANTALLL